MHSKLSTRIILFILVFGFISSTIFPQKEKNPVSYEELEYLDSVYSKIIEDEEKHVDYLQQRIKYWEYQLTGMRRFFWPTSIVRNWINHWKKYIAEHNKVIEKTRELRDKAIAQMEALETRAGLVGFWKPVDTKLDHSIEFIEIADGKFEGILRRAGHLSKYTWKPGQQIVRNLTQEKLGDLVGEILYKYTRGGVFVGQEWQRVVIKILSETKIMVGPYEYNRIR
jgi:hypothetical protein